MRWNGYQWRNDADGVEIVPTEAMPENTMMLISDKEVVVAKNVGLDRPQLETVNPTLQWEINVPIPPRLVLVTIKCEVADCDRHATSRVGDAVNVCADHITTVIEDGDEVIAL